MLPRAQGPAWMTMITEMALLRSPTRQKARLFFCFASLSVGCQFLVRMIKCCFCICAYISGVLTTRAPWPQRWISGSSKLLPRPKNAPKHTPTQNTMCFSPLPIPLDSDPCHKTLLVVLDIVIRQNQTLKGQPFRFSSLLWLTPYPLLAEDCPQPNPSRLLLLRRSLLGWLVSRP